MDKKKQTLWWVIGLLILVAVVGVVYYMNRPLTETGTKQITVQVEVPGEETKTFTYDTDENYLGGLLRDQGLVNGENSSTGFYVTEVNGIKADESKQQWWKLQQNGTDATTGVDDLTINNGDTYSFILTEGY